MLSLFVMLTSLTLCQTTPATDTTSFYAWWDSTNYKEEHELVPLDIRRVKLPLENLKEVIIQRSLLAVQFKSAKYRGFQLLEHTAYQIILVCPVYTSDERLSSPDSSSESCSWLRVDPDGKWCPIDLEPFSNDCYGPDEVHFVLYWLPQEQYPLIEMTTNDPASVPRFLFRFDPADKIYKLVRHDCGG